MFNPEFNPQFEQGRPDRQYVHGNSLYQLW